MKKQLITLAVMLIAVLMVTGCGRNETTLNCTMESFSFEVSMDATFRNDELRRIVMTTEVDFSEEELDEDQIEELREEFATACEEFDYEGVTCTTNVSDTVASMTLTVNMQQVTEDVLSSLNLEFCKR